MPASTFSLWSPSDKSASITLSMGNSVADGPNASVDWESARGDQVKTAGKHYAECEMEVDSHSISGVFGVGDASASLANYCGSDSHGWGLQISNSGSTGYLLLAGGATALGIAYGTGTRTKVALDVNNGNGWLGVVGVGWLGSGSPDPATGTDPTFTFTPGTGMYLMTSHPFFHTTNKLVNTFLDAVPSGFNPGWYT